MKSVRLKLRAPSAALAFGLLAAQGAPAIAEEAPLKKLTDHTVSISEHSFASYNIRISQELLLGGAGLCLVFGFYAWRRREKTAVPYTLAASIGAVMLANPQLITQHFSPVPDEVIVAVDRTASQKLGDRAAMTEASRLRLIQALQALPNTHIREVTIDPPADSADDQGTRLFAALDAMSDVNWNNVAGIIALTDGQIADVPKKPSFGAGVPFYALISGHEGETDRLAQLNAAPHFGLVGEEQVVRFEIRDTGVTDQTPHLVNVRITTDGQALQAMQVNTGQIVEARVRVRNAGANIFSFEADPLSGEVTTVNNSFVVKIEGTRESFNVLIIGGRITPDAATLRRVFKADPDSNLIHAMPLRLTENSDATPDEKFSLTPVPLDEIFGEALKRFNLVILDRFEDSGVLPPSYLEGIRSYVEKGGALLNIAGPEYNGVYSVRQTPLGAIMPTAPAGSVTVTPFRPHLTALGARHPVTRSLEGAGSDTVEPSWGEWLRMVDSKVSLSGQVVMQTPDGKPLLVLAEVGKGRVAALQSDSFPSWERGLNGGGPAGPLLRHLAHWAMKDPAFADESLRVSAGIDRVLHIERHTLSENGPAPVRIELPDGQSIQESFTRQAAPGIWEADHVFSDPGIYRMTTTDEKALTAFINIGNANTPEFANIVSTDRLLHPVASATGGAIFRMASGKPDQIVLPDIRQINRHDWTGKAGPGQIVLVQASAKVLEGLDRQSIPGWVGWSLMAASLAWGYSGRRTMARSGTIPGAGFKSLKIN